MNFREMTKQQLAEESMIDIAYAILTERKEPLTLAQLLEEIKGITGVSDKVLKSKMLQFYTDMNIDGRFLAINDNRWGLREWYPVEQIEVETAPVVKVRKKKKKKKSILDLDEDDDLEVEEDDEDEDELFDEDYDELLDEEDDIEDDEEVEEDDDEEIVEIEVDLLDPDDELEILPDEDELDVDLDEDDDEIEE